jgi:glucosamine-phosphate N-acetyltransferase
VGQVKDLCVAPSQKGKNLGLRMLEQLNQLAIDAGCSKTWVMTQDVNEAFYKQRGKLFHRSFLMKRDLCCVLG